MKQWENRRKTLKNIDNIHSRNETRHSFATANNGRESQRNQ